MSLEKYYKKRNFTKTTEPRGEEKISGKMRFVVHKHQATHLHYDFRLEIDGVLKSWAVPKELPKILGIKRLALAVEDHPIDYIDFHGIISKGQYGAGTVEIWDSGKYKLIDRTENRFEFLLTGKKLVGEYVLLKMTGPKWKKNHWLLFKKQ